MLQLAPTTCIHIAIAPIDFRKGFNAITALCQYELGIDPFNGYVFAFRNRRKNAVKLLTYDGNGFWLCTKRFSSGKLAWWPTSNTLSTPITAVQLHVLLQQGSPEYLRLPEDWLPLTQAA
jgi:hypothetical protein